MKTKSLNFDVFLVMSLLHCIAFDKKAHVTNKCKITHLFSACMPHKACKEPVKFESQPHYCEINKKTRLLLKVS